MNHRETRAEACARLFQGFEPDLTKCRDPERVRVVLQMAAGGFYSHEIAEALRVTPKTIQKIYRRYDFPKLDNFCPPRREDRQGWKGGIKEVKGYLYSRTPGHPYASKHGEYVAVHRLVMERELGRYLKPTEVVDHIDRDTRNNDPSNLRVFASNSDHLRATLAGRCPNWSDAGRLALAKARSKRRRTWKGQRIEPSRVESETDADQ